jgi:hypothetical protein
MKRVIPCTLLLAVLALLGMATTAAANPQVRDDWLGTYLDACQTLRDAASGCNLCHSGGLNSYGQSIADHGIVPAEAFDPDGDGVNSGQEILDCTFPGDESSVRPLESVTWGAIKKLYD